METYLHSLEFRVHLRWFASEKRFRLLLVWQTPGWWLELQTILIALALRFHSREGMKKTHHDFSEELGVENPLGMVEVMVVEEGEFLYFFEVSVWDYWGSRCSLMLFLVWEKLELDSLGEMESTPVLHHFETIPAESKSKVGAVLPYDNLVLWPWSTIAKTSRTPIPVRWFNLPSCWISTWTEVESFFEWRRALRF